MREHGDVDGDEGDMMRTGDERGVGIQEWP